MLPFVPTGPRLSPAALQTQRDSTEEAVSRHSQQLLVVLPTTHNASTRILKDNLERLPLYPPPLHTHTHNLNTGTCQLLTGWETQKMKIPPCVVGRNTGFSGTLQGFVLHYLQIP